MYFKIGKEILQTPDYDHTWQWLWPKAEHLAQFLENTDTYNVSLFNLKVQMIFSPYHPALGYKDFKLKNVESLSCQWVFIS